MYSSTVYSNFTTLTFHRRHQQEAQLRRAIAVHSVQGALVLAIIGGTVLVDDYVADIDNHGDIIGLQIYRIRWEKHKIRAIMPFKVIQGQGLLVSYLRGSFHK